MGPLDQGCAIAPRFLSLRFFPKARMAQSKKKNLHGDVPLCASYPHLAAIGLQGFSGPTAAHEIIHACVCHWLLNLPARGGWQGSGAVMGPAHGCIKTHCQPWPAPPPTCGAGQ